LALPKLLKGDFSVGFTLALMHKDVRLATKLGNDSATSMVLANIVRELFQTVINEHGARKDTQTLVKLFERNAGVAIAPRNCPGGRASQHSISPLTRRPALGLSGE
jgi:NAD-binding of NADP-dependent 3-hydroxyisobutyrate dehydrogenase